MRRLNNMSPRVRSDRRAFTLLELLIVIVIVALLAGLILPTLGRARLTAKRAACQANLAGIGRAAAMYQSQYGDFVPICWINRSPADVVHPFRSWRGMLLPYLGYAGFNCPAARDSGTIGAVFHSADEILGQELHGTTNAGSYGVMYQYSLPEFEIENCYAVVAQGHPMWSNVFSSLPGRAWRSPARSVYVADSALTKGPITYPTQGYKDYGSSAVLPPSADGYREAAAVSRRFADRHGGTNCLFVTGNVSAYVTEELDAMKAGESDCVWDAE